MIGCSSISASTLHVPSRSTSHGEYYLHQLIKRHPLDPGDPTIGWKLKLYMCCRVLQVPAESTPWRRLQLWLSGAFSDCGLGCYDAKGNIIEHLRCQSSICVSSALYDDVHPLAECLVNNIITCVVLEQADPDFANVYQVWEHSRVNTLNPCRNLYE